MKIRQMVGVRFTGQGCTDLGQKSKMIGFLFPKALKQLDVKLRLDIALDDYNAVVSLTKWTKIK